MHIPLIPALRRQTDLSLCEFKAILFYVEFQAGQNCPVRRRKKNREPGLCGEIILLFSRHGLCHFLALV